MKAEAYMGGGAEARVKSGGCESERLIKQEFLPVPKVCPYMNRQKGSLGIHASGLW